MGTRQVALKAWCEQELQQSVFFDNLNGDASFRRYFRVILAGVSLIAVDAPPENENTKAFVRVANFLSRAGIRVPRIMAVDLDRGFMLLEDFGDELLLHNLNSLKVSTYYQESILTLLRFSVLPKFNGLLEFDKQSLTEEMDLFSHWFMGQLMRQGDVSFDMKHWLADWNKLTGMLVSEALSQPKVFVHRDFHSRNLMCLDLNTIPGSETPSDSIKDELGVIDFQDAVWGPLTYDLVSLLKDCYVKWPREAVLEWALDYLFQWKKVQQDIADLSDQTKEEVASISEAQFLQWFEWMGIQRHLKALGIFARLWLRDQKMGYLGDMPRTLDYIIEVCNEYPELSFAIPLFDTLRSCMNQNSLRSLFSSFKH